MIFDRPTSSELIKAVMDFLDTKIKDELPPHLAFKLRITNNVLGMVQREIDLGETLQQEVYDAMQNLMHSDELTTKKLSELIKDCLLYTSPSPRDQRGSRMPSSA